MEKCKHCSPEAIGTWHHKGMCLRCKETIIAEIDTLNSRALARRNKAKDQTIKGLRPTATDWMTTEELERYQDLQAALIPFTRQDRADAAVRVAEKRADRVKLDFERRQEAERLIEAAQNEDVLRELIYELLSLRQRPA